MRHVFLQELRKFVHITMSLSTKKKLKLNLWEESESYIPLVEWTDLRVSVVL